MLDDAADDVGGHIVGVVPADEAQVGHVSEVEGEADGGPHLEEKRGVLRRTGSARRRGWGQKWIGRRGMAVVGMVGMGVGEAEHADHGIVQAVHD